MRDAKKLIDAGCARIAEATVFNVTAEHLDANKREATAWSCREPGRSLFSEGLRAILAGAWQIETAKCDADLTRWADDGGQYA